MTKLVITLAQRNAARSKPVHEFVAKFAMGFGFVTGAVIMFVVMVGWLR